MECPFSLYQMVVNLCLQCPYVLPSDVNIEYVVNVYVHPT